MKELPFTFIARAHTLGMFMNPFFGLVLFIVAWLVLTQWLLPKLGVPT